MPRFFLGFCILALCVSFPLAIHDQYLLNIAIMTAIYAILALGLNVVVGFAGLLVLGFAGFYGIGAYTTAILTTTFHLSFWGTIPIAVALSTLFGMGLGFPTLRLRGDYLAIVTLGFGEIARLVFTNWVEVTRGPMGIPGIPPPSIRGWEFTMTGFYYLALGLVLFCLLLIYRLETSPIGRAWKAIREDEQAAEAMGVDTVRYKVAAFSISAGMAGLAGSFFASFISFVGPTSFTFMESVLILCMVVFGGRGKIPGVILGAIVLIALPEILRGLVEYRMLIFGLLLVLVMIFRPQGLVGEKA